MVNYRKIDPRIWNDDAFQVIWAHRWESPSRCPRQNPWPLEKPLPPREQLCRSRRMAFKWVKIRNLAAVLGRLGNKCLICGVNNVETLDHVLPIAWGGTNELANLQPVCHACNTRKGAQLPEAPDA